MTTSGTINQFFASLKKQTAVCRTLLGLYGLWLVAAGATIIINLTNLVDNPYIWISLAGRLSLMAVLVLHVKRFFFLRAFNASSYESWKHFLGYAIVLSYFFCVLPQVVYDFYGLRDQGESLAYVGWVIGATLPPIAIWIILSLDKTRLNTGAYTAAELEERTAIRKDKHRLKKHRLYLRGKRGLLSNFWFDWGDVIVGSLLWVLLIHNFFLQLYVIPSESMAPAFLVNDRVAVTKTLYGPPVPLTNHQLPTLVGPKTGDIVTFTNPDYSDNDPRLGYSSIFSRLFQPLIYFLTLTQVDIDSELSGQPKARLLVKRVIGEPGDRLCIVNDTVYKQKKDGQWQSMVEIKGKKYGESDLYQQDYPQLRRQRISPEIRLWLDRAIAVVEKQNEPLTTEPTSGGQDDFEGLAAGFAAALKSQSADPERRVRQGLQAISGAAAEEQEKLQALSHAAAGSSFSAGADQNTNRWAALSRALPGYGVIVYRRLLQDFADFLNLIKDNPDQLEGFLALPAKTETAGDPYSLFMSKANRLFKSRRLQFYAYLLNNLAQKDGMAATAFLSDFKLQTQNDSAPAGFNDLKLLHFYFFGLEYTEIQYFRYMNLPPFPEKEGEVIPEDEYFVLGDNRYNSQDSRYGNYITRTPLDKSDPGDFGLKVPVNWQPRTIALRLINGRTRLTIFPFNRIRFF